MKLKTYLIKLISFYQKKNIFSSKRNCVFYPTCSDYSKEAIEKYGVLKGLHLSFRRILRCHPFTTPQIDKVP